MNCDKVKDLLGSYYDNEATDAVRRDVAAHLGSCQGCQASLDEWALVSSQVFAKASTQKAPAYLWTRVLAGIEAREMKNLWWAQWDWMSKVTAVATVLVALGSFYLMRNAALPLDAALEGRWGHQNAIQLAS